MNSVQHAKWGCHGLTGFFPYLVGRSVQFLQQKCHSITPCTTRALKHLADKRTGELVTTIVAQSMKFKMLGRSGVGRKSHAPTGCVCNTATMVSPKGLGSVHPELRNLTIKCQEKPVFLRGRRNWVVLNRSVLSPGQALRRFMNINCCIYWPWAVANLTFQPLFKAYHVLPGCWFWSGCVILVNCSKRVINQHTDGFWFVPIPARGFDK